MIGEGIEFAPLEASIYRAQFDDGLLDILGGLAIALIGLGWLTEPALGGIAPVVLIPFWPLLRKKITAPRIGEVEFSTARKALMQRGVVAITILLTVSSLVGMAVFLLWEMGGPAWRPLLHVVAPLWPGIIVAVLLAVGGVIIKATRFYGYGLYVLVVAVVVSGLLGLRPGVYLLIGGVPVALAGGVVLARFVRQNPVLPQGS
jgi:hypothetical protein